MASRSLGAVPCSPDHALRPNERATDRPLRADAGLTFIGTIRTPGPRARTARARATARTARSAGSQLEPPLGRRARRARSRPDPRRALLAAPLAPRLDAAEPVRTSTAPRHLRAALAGRGRTRSASPGAAGAPRGSRCSSCAASTASTARRSSTSSPTAAPHSPKNSAWIPFKFHTLSIARSCRHLGARPRYLTRKRVLVSPEGFEPSTN